MSKQSRVRLRKDTDMANFSANACLKAHRQGKTFSLEHPGRSLAMHLEAWQKLLKEPGVAAINFHTCMFAGSRRRKSQLLVTNHPGLKSSMGRICRGKATCDRSGLPHLRWRPVVANGKVVAFNTGDETEAPLGFCESFAEAIAKATLKSTVFLEVFSGRNAPLSMAVGRRLGAEVPGHALARGQRGEKTLILSAACVAGTSVLGIQPYHANPHQPLAESQSSRLASIGAGKQPSYGKRNQLIPDGLRNPSAHLKLATQLAHPFSEERPLKEDHRKALDFMSEFPKLDAQARLSVLGELKALASSREVSELQQLHESRACTSAKALGRKPRTALMTMLGKRFSIEDTAVPILCLTGMPIVGEALSSPFFEPCDVPASLTTQELLATAPRRRHATLEKVERVGRKSSRETARAVWEKTIKEVNQGSMRGPLTFEQVVSKHGPFFNVVPSFGLEQGVDESGNPKFRRIDDHTASLNNLAAHRKQKIEMAMIDYLMVMVKCLSSRFGCKVHVGTEDMKGAYRQVPLSDSQVSISITAVYNPDTDTAELFEIFGQPFGAGHAVPNFYRVAEWICRLIIRMFHVLLDHFFDDFFLVSRERDSNTSIFCLQETFRLLGFVLDKDKSQLPREVAEVLGVALNTQAITSERRLLVQPKHTRKLNFGLLVDRILASNYLPPSLAASLVGKFGFLCSTMFGKVGRCCATSVRARQYSSSQDCSLDSDLRTSLMLMKLFMQLSPPRSLKLDSDPHPVLLYTDASDVPERLEGRWAVGVVIAFFDEG